MKFVEIVKDIKDLGVYSPEQWEEYINYFVGSNDLERHLLEQPVKTHNRLLQRIQKMQGADPVEPDYSLSEKVVRSNFLSSGKRESMTLGVVSGCFDLLHLGHVRGMVYAKQFLEKYQNPVLCALTLSDDNIRAKKGESRPVLNLNERLDMICNVECVDYVIPLEEPNCLAVLDRLRPEYFFKGSADRSQEIVRNEMELVESYGGSVVIFPPRPDVAKSTTKLIEGAVEKIMREW